MSSTTARRATRTTLLLLMAGVATMLLGAPAHAATEVRLTGDNGNNFFIVRYVSSTQVEFCTDLLGCFTRPSAEVEQIAIDGLDGDDGLFLYHGAGFISHPTVPLALTFDGGVGSDELRICTRDSGPTGLSTAPACSSAVTTDVSVLPDVNEVRVVQCRERKVHGGRCVDEPFQQPVPTLKINARGVDVLTDLAPGPLTVLGTPGADAVTVDAGEVFANPTTGTSATTGRVSVNNIATVQHLNKENVTVDPGAGEDAVVAAGRQGFAATTTSCARDGASAGAPLCIYGGPELGDSLEVAAGSTAEAVALTTRPSDTARLTGLAVPPAMDVHGVDALTIPQQPSQGDAFTLNGSPVADAFAWDARTPDTVVITGDLATGTTAPAPIPATSLIGDGTGALRVTIDALAGADVVRMVSGADADDLDLSLADGAFGVTTAHTAGPLPHSTVTTRAEVLELSTGDGPDVLRVIGGLAPDVRWHAGAGPDELHFTGTGSPLVADLASGRVWEGTVTAPALGVLATEVESWRTDAAGSSLTALGTAGTDAIRYQPGDATSATVGLDGRPVITATGIAGSFTIDPAGGDDVVQVAGTSGVDAIAVGRGARTTVQVGQSLPVRAADSTESVAIDGGTGDDRFLVTGEGGTATFTLLGGGHTGGDRLSFAAAQSSAHLTFGAAPSAGTLTAGGPAIAFRDLEHVDVEGDDAGSLTVDGSDGPDTIVQDGGSITVGRGTTASFTRYPTLALAGGAGDDDVVVAPRTLIGVADVAVAGGDAGTDRLVVRGSELRDTLRYEPTAPDGGRVEVSLAPAITFTGTEAVEVDGRTAPPSGDTLLVHSPAIAGTLVVSPGTAVDEGSVAISDATGPVTSFPTLHFGRLGRGSVIVDGHDGAGTATDAVRIVGQPDADVVSIVVDGAGGAIATLDTRIPVHTSGVTALQLQGLDGQDTFHVPAATALPPGAVGAPAVAIDAGGPSGGDVAVLTGTGDVAVDLAARTATQVGDRPVAFSGLDRLDLAAGGSAVTVRGGGAPDAVTARPTGADAAQVTSDLVATRLDLSGAGALLVDTGEGADQLAVLGRTVAEPVGVTRGDSPQVRVAGLLPVTAAASVEAIAVDALEGADTITVEGAGGPASLALTGGAPTADGDVVRLVAPDAAVTFADPPTGGRLDSPGGALSFAGVDVVDVVGDGSGALTVRGTDAPDTITLGDPGAPAVRVNGGAPVTYRGYPSLSLDGRGGGDALAISYTNPGDVTAITATGGSAMDDVVRVIDTAGTARAWRVRPLDADHAVVTAGGGAPSVTATGASRVELLGLGAGDTVAVISPTGAHDIAVQPAGVADAGSVRVGSHVPVAFADLGLDGLLAIGEDTMPPEDHVILEGSAIPDTVTVTGADSSVRLGGFLPVVARGANALTVRGGEGTDTFAATGPLPWATTSLVGGGPDDGDAVRLDGPTGAAVVDLAAATVSGFGGTVHFPEVDGLQTTHAAGALTLVGTPRDDAFCYDPLTPRDGRIHVIASPGGGLLTDSCQPAPGTLDVLHTFIDVGRLTVDPREGADQVLINGTVNDDAIVVESTGPEVAVSVNPSPADTTAVRLPVQVVTPTTENVIFAGDNGVDDVDVRVYEAAAPVFTIHGEAPDTRKADQLIVRDMSGGANINDTGSAVPGSGTVTVDWRRFSATEVVVNYTGFEGVRLYKMQRPR